MGINFKTIIGKSPSEFPTIFDYNMEQLEKVIKDLHQKMDEVRYESNNNRKRLVEVNDSKVSKDELIDLDKKLNSLHSKLVIIKKENLKLSKTINRDRTIKLKTNLDTNKNSNNLAGLKEDVNKIEGLIERKLKDIQTVDAEFDEKVIEEYVNKKVEKIKSEMTPPAPIKHISLDSVVPSTVL